MNKSVTTVQVWDAGPGTTDRYTLLPPATAVDHKIEDKWHGVCCGADPQGMSYRVVVAPGRHLGRVIKLSATPIAVQYLAHNEWPEHAPLPNGLTQPQYNALENFKRRFGAEWKYELSSRWTTGRDVQCIDGALLRQIRNTLGPAWLAEQK